MTNVVVIEYNAGNTLSVQSALSRLGAEVLVTRDPDKIKAADKVVFPGVGHAASAVKWLKEFRLFELIAELHQPVLGICLGMQLMTSFCEEGQVDTLGVFKARCSQFEKRQVKVPHMGWNQVQHHDSSLFKNIPTASYFYFVHSYRVPICESTTAICEYENKFSAALENKNFFGVQFHPEKSGYFGEQLLRNFIEL